MTTYTARPTIYNGVKMRSRLEAGFAAWLDERGFEWEYEPECFANDTGQYLPDFVLFDLPVTGGGSPVTYVEVKPSSPAESGRRRMGASELEKRLSIIWSSRPDAMVLNVWPATANDTGLAHLAHLHPDGVALFGAPGVLRPATWCWGKAADGTLRPGVSTPMNRAHAPWPDEYWKPRT